MPKKKGLMRVVYIHAAVHSPTLRGEVGSARIVQQALAGSGGIISGEQPATRFALCSTAALTWELKGETLEAFLQKFRMSD